jgi:hypothetical protein
MGQRERERERERERREEEEEEGEGGREGEGISQQVWFLAGRYQFLSQPSPRVPAAPSINLSQITNITT